MSMKMPAPENQEPVQDHSVSGEYPCNDNDPNVEPVSGPVSVPAPVSIKVDKVEAHEAEEFGNRPTLAAIEAVPDSKTVISQRVATANKTAKLLDSSTDERLNSGDLDDNFKAFNEQVAYQQRMVKEVEHHILEENRQVAHFELTRKSRGFFSKIADFASNVWSGTTPEERAKGIQGVGGVKGFFSGSNGLQNQLLKRAGIDPREVKTAPAVQSQPAVAAQPDEEYPLPMNKLFQREQKPAVTAQPDAEYPLPMNKIFERKEKLPAAQPDPEYPLPMNSSIVEDIKDTASKIVAGIGGFFRKLLPSKSTSKKLAVVGALATGIAVTGGSSCGKGCTELHPWHKNPVASSSASGSAPAPSQSVAEVPTAVPTASTNPSTVASNDPAPVPDIDTTDKNDTKKEEVKKAPKLAKVSTLPKTDVYHPPKVQEQKKPEQPKTAELKDCKPDQVLTEANLDKCLVPGGDADKLRGDFYTQADAQQKALDGVFAPIKNGPEYVSAGVYQRDATPIAFLEGQGVPNDPETPNLIWRQNAANKKIVADALVAVRAKIADAKTPKDFYAITEDLAQIGIRIDELIAERGKQIASNIDAANTLNTQHAKDKMSDIEKHTGKKVNAVPFETHKNGATVTKSTIDLPMTNQLLQGSEPDMLAPATGKDPDTVIASVQKKIEYYRGILQLNRDLDDVRVKQRPANARVMDALQGGVKTAVKPGPRLTASAK